MQYKENPKTGDRLSRLGFGCMRLPGSFEQSEAQIMRAIAGGVNFFDTAYLYPGSEVKLGKILEKNHCRDTVFIATKMPPHLLRKYEDFDKVLNAELERLRTDRIDYFYFHMLTQLSDWTRICELGAPQWVAEKKAQGKIRSVGFSYHGGKDEFVKLVDAYDWDHCMIQYNYFDENTQAGKTGLMHAAEKGIPVMIMEPLRGGQLASKVPDAAQALFKEANPNRSFAEWGLRWVWNHDAVYTVLSGMNSMEMIEENMRVADSAQAGDLSDAELAMFERAREILWEHTNVPCTGCGYCMPCPSGVDIPLCFASYNDLGLSANKFGPFSFYIMMVGNKNASKCIGCGKCEKHCPQSIAIREELQHVKGKLEPFFYRPVKFVAQRFMRKKAE